jgi:hypothetical protein
MEDTVDEPIKLVTTRSDREIAEEHRQKIIVAAQTLCSALTDCKRDGFDVGVNFSLVTVYPPTVGLSGVTISKVF